VNGPQGSGKTFMLELLRRLIDPIMAPARNLPEDERDLFAATKSSHVLSFDNQSGITASMADALCRLATGGGFSTRALHTNDEEHVIEASKPIMLNGIPELTRRADLADRSFVVRAAKLAPGRRQAVDDLRRAFSEAEPLILGALFGAVSDALRTHLDTALPAVRMADAARFMIAAGEQFGWDKAQFSQLLETNRLDAIETVIDSDPFTMTLLALLETEPNWRGSMTELLSALTDRVAPKIARSRTWPTTPNGANAALNRAKDSLEARGFEFDRGQEGPKREKRFIQFRKIDESDQA
jgi:putative DNA primase/helicase